ncbi:MAG: VCBS repeat-containing protein [Deltaproteobacteria bacterium]|nr:VCBS repeat-containing protein [Deltaproteobacteria bacterium]
MVPAPGLAEAPANRFQSLSGYLVQVGPQGVVVDCGRKKGVAVGDLLAVLQAGPPLFHPVSGQPLGAQERLLAVLKVLRVEADYALCRPLNRYLRVPLNRGAVVRRFAAMAALFIDLNGNGMALFSRVREALPQLNWADYGVGLQHRFALRRPGGPGALGYDLYVVNQGSDLTFYNGDQELVAAWNAAQFSGPVGFHDAPDSPSAEKKNRGPYKLSTTAGKALLTSYREMAEVNLVVKGMDVGDLERDGVPEMVFTDGEKIFVYQMTELGLKFCYRYHFDKWGSIVNLQVGDIDGDRRDEIIVNTFNETEDGFSSFVIARDGGKYRIVADNVPFVMGLLGGRSVADKGVYFVGQGFAAGDLFGSLVYRLSLKKGAIASVGEFAVPLGFTLPGALYEDINNDRIKELCFINKQNFLEIYQGSQRLWVSDERLAGSLQDVQYEVGTAKVSYTEKRQISAPLRAYDIDGDGAKELLLVDNETGMSTSLGEYGFLKKGCVKMVRKSGGGFDVQNLTGALGGPLQGLQVVKDELVCAMVKRGDDLLQLSGDTFLLAFPLPRK